VDQAGAYEVGLPLNGGGKRPAAGSVSRNDGQQEFGTAPDTGRLNFAPEAKVENYGVLGEIEF
jgi:hypothetical protein